MAYKLLYIIDDVLYVEYCIKQSKAKQSKAKQSKAKESKAKQSKAKQSKASKKASNGFFLDVTVQHLDVQI